MLQYLSFIPDTTSDTILLLAMDKKNQKRFLYSELHCQIKFGWFLFDDYIRHGNVKPQYNQ